ncbi:Acyl-coenzyme A synthetase acsm4, mitochondrial-like [Desmophyllum pertusum]|uniref:medium-chain acyl-CoA ligase n=1 Tax=Desmophyllum pertusum TaxID=174260 RepID=A0A9W9Z7C7_9CNID|nr:Acyl-coenzyme A synthetase acsm4, mitochondrial-like [Desmophyllum pertusum]
MHSMYMNALEEEDVKSFSFPTLRYCIGGGEPINKQVLFKWKEETGMQLFNYYGQTEIADLSPGDDEGRASCGKAFPGVDMLIVDDNDQEVPPGTLGRVAVRVKPYRPVGMFTRYVDDPEKTAACFSGDLYFTGDVGRMDAEGYFWIIGRADELVNCYSHLVNPYDVENCLKEHPAVLDCAVVSSPNLMGETTKAFVVLSGGFKSRNQDEMIKELQDHVTCNTGKWMSPKKVVVEFIKDLPKTVVGKVNRQELKNREWSSSTQ